ncbi:hypothetical protein Fuma_00432 [Fuerstiella marisgermanici]|uniref:Uncharacterized protein n=1 Tax=Fuerstiella marisgermanici TaxID=1891926 RepID=A0A1P8W9W2_9PLAN|nr:hypothetical protein Fuma_00432 [Fuerstiella marisgermanici]
MARSENGLWNLSTKQNRRLFPKGTSRRSQCSTDWQNGSKPVSALKALFSRLTHAHGEQQVCPERLVARLYRQHVIAGGDSVVEVPTFNGFEFYR